jgi:hypothetical protein
VLLELQQQRIENVDTDAKTPEIMPNRQIMKLSKSRWEYVSKSPGQLYTSSCFGWLVGWLLFFFGGAKQV